MPHKVRISTESFLLQRSHNQVSYLPNVTHPKTTMRRSHKYHLPPAILFVPLIILIVLSDSKEFSSTNYRYCTCCHAFGLSRPLSLPSWLRQPNTSMNVNTKTATEPEVYMDVSSVADVLLTNGENKKTKEKKKNGQPQQQMSTLPLQSETATSPSCAGGLPILPIDQSTLQESSSSAEILPSSPPLTFEKYMTMTSKRVPVEIRYNSQQGGLRPFFLTVAKKIKAHYPDVVVQKTDLATAGVGGESPGDSMVFEVLVDGRPVVGKAETKRQSISRSDSGGGSSGSSSSGGASGDGPKQPVDLANGISVYVSMAEIDMAITKARRKRRPSTTYSQQGEDMGGEGVSVIRLEVLRSRQQRQSSSGSNDHHWD